MNSISIIRIALALSAFFTFGALQAQLTDDLAESRPKGDPDMLQLEAEDTTTISVEAATAAMTADIAAHLQANLVYPELAREQHLTGRVMLRIQFDTEGRSYRVELYHGDDELLSKAALDAMAGIVLEERYRGHRDIIVPVDFRMD